MQHRLAYAVFVIQGLGILLPWNAFISAADYFTKLYGQSFVFFISLVYPITSLYFTNIPLKEISLIYEGLIGQGRCVIYS
jgi:hypothetical protein